MIESRYWREELSRIAKTIMPLRKPSRWSERAHCVVERDLLIGFFIIRRLIQLNKVSSRTRDFRLRVYACPATGIEVTQLNKGWILEIYDLVNEKQQTKKPLYISNQFLHAYMSFVWRSAMKHATGVMSILFQISIATTVSGVSQYLLFGSYSSWHLMIILQSWSTIGVPRRMTTK